MKSKTINKQKEQKASNLQKLYAERMERFMALIELSYALKISPRIIQKKQ